MWCASETNLGGIAVNGNIAPARYAEVRWLNGNLAMHIGMLASEDGDEGRHRGISGVQVEESTRWGGLGVVVVQKGSECLRHGLFY